jgi:AbrB family looped-hinge helix DNA binding protein
MMEYAATIGAKGQVTIPAAIRRRLGLRAGDDVAFALDDGGAVRLRRTPRFEELRGIVPPLPGRETIDFEDLIEEAMQEEADRIVREMGGL